MLNEQQQKALAALHAALLICRDARLEIVAGSPGVYIRDYTRTWSLESKGDSLESYDLAEYSEGDAPALATLQRYGVTAMEADAIFEDEEGEFVRFADVQGLQVQAPDYCDCCYTPSEVAENFIAAIEAAGVKVKP